MRVGSAKIMIIKSENRINSKIRKLLLTLAKCLFKRKGLNIKSEIGITVFREIRSKGCCSSNICAVALLFAIVVDVIEEHVRRVS